MKTHGVWVGEGGVSKVLREFKQMQQDYPSQEKRYFLRHLNENPSDTNTHTSVYGSYLHCTRQEGFNTAQYRHAVFNFLFALMFVLTVETFISQSCY